MARSGDRGLKPFSTKGAGLFAAVFLLVFSGAPAWALDLTQKSISSSKQFTVYCADATLRRRVANFADEVKTGVLQILGESDRWRYPILLTMERAATDRPGQEAATLMVLQGELGFKVQIDVRIGADPAAVNLQRHLVRAILLEYSYRLNPEYLEGGKPFVEAPWWLVEGTIQAFRMRESGPDTDLFKRIIDVNHLPPLEHLLSSRPEELGNGTAEAVDRACALCLLQLLLEQPTGRPGLGNYLRHLPTAIPDVVAALRRDFPGLGNSPEDLQKWWTLNLARLAAADRYKGLSPEETDGQLAALLQFEVAAGKGGQARSFGIDEFAEYLKRGDAARAVLAEKHDGLMALSTRSNALYAEILGEYEQIFSLLIRGKTHGIKERLARVAASREFLLRRKAEIADYMNWFEGTQMDVSSRAFEGYMRVANELDVAPRRTDPITKYLDEISKEL